MVIESLSIVAYAIQALELVPKIVAAGRDIAAYVGNAKAVLETAHEIGFLPDGAWDDLKATREALQKELHKGEGV